MAMPSHTSAWPKCRGAALFHATLVAALAAWVAHAAQEFDLDAVAAGWGLGSIVHSIEHGLKSFFTNPVHWSRPLDSAQAADAARAVRAAEVRALLEGARRIAVRDGGCTHQGCDAPIERTQIHHTHHWNHGGNTNIDELVAKVHLGPVSPVANDADFVRRIYLDLTGAIPTNVLHCERSRAECADDRAARRGAN